ncbi:MAG: hypothetical protein EA426_00875 [Spirochaetaceae bacterium]|nr:MAG: hypothetical protein EA426_00875 [Spirochaetaceae bacterium]
MLVTVIVFVSGRFVELHPDAYRDGLLSIVYVYPVVLLVGGLYALVRRVSRGNRSMTLHGFIRRSRECGVLTGIAIVFTVITVINNIMMLTGIDAPKEGLFAYQHMLVRIAIVTGAITIAMAKETVRGLRRFFSFFASTLTTRKALLAELTSGTVHVVTRRPFEASVKSFTGLTFLICLAAVIASPWREPVGGAPFYIALLALYGVLLIAFAGIRFFRARST